MRAHWCWIDSECRYEHDAYEMPYRLQFDHNGWVVMIGTRNGKSQTWNPRDGVTKTWRRISIHPPRERYCGQTVSINQRSGRADICTRLSGHRGQHKACVWP